MERSPLHPAGIGPRLGAALIDLLVLFMQYNFVVFFFSLVAFLVGLVGRRLQMGRPVFLAARGIYWLGVAWSILVALAYFPYWWQRDGQTFGMRLLKLRVVIAGPPARDVGLMRALVRGVASLLSLGLLTLGFLWILIDERRQGWHDKLAGTLVVRSTYGSHGGEA